MRGSLALQHLCGNCFISPVSLISGPASSCSYSIPLIPWIGVMLAGYALGPVFTLERAARVQKLVALGSAITAGFIVLRATNLYGDPAPWTVQNSLLPTVLAFL